MKTKANNISIDYEVAGEGKWLRPGSEREMGFEPTTLCLGSRCSTPELLPHKSYLF